MGTYCYNTIKEDEKISEYVNTHNPIFQWSPKMVTVKRQFYNRVHKDKPLNITEDNISDIGEILIQFEYEQKRTRHNEVYSPEGGAYRNLAKQVRRLKVLPMKFREDSVELISYYFSQAIDKVLNKEENKKLTREQVANGYKDKFGKSHYGEDFIFEQIYEHIQVIINNLSIKLNDTTDSTEKNRLNLLIGNYGKILNNWTGLVTVAKKNLFFIEGLKLGTSRSFAKYLSIISELEDDINENAEELDRDPENIVRPEQVSNFKSASQSTRNLLKKLYIIDENGRPIVNSFGVPKTMNPVAAHNFLSNILTEAKRASDCITLLKTYEGEGSRFLAPLIAEIDVDKEYLDPSARQSLSPVMIAKNKIALDKLSNLFLDFNKVNQPYGLGYWEGQTFGIRILNKQRNNPLKSKYSLALLDLESSHTPYTLWDSDGNLTPSRFRQFKQDIEWFKNGGSLTSVNNEKDWFKIQYKSGIVQSAGHRLHNIAIYMGIPVDESVCKRIVANPKMLGALLKNMDGIYKETITHFDRGLSGGNKTFSYEDFYSFKDFKKGTIEKDTRSHVARFADNMLNDASLFVKDAYSAPVESKVSTKNAKGDYITLFSQINPGYLSQFIKNIQIRANNLEELRAWIDEQFSNNSIFCNFEIAKKESEENEGEFKPTKKFRLKWLNDLYNGNNKAYLDASPETGWLFNQNIKVTRILGDNFNKPFEDFSPSEHLELIFASYFGVLQQTKGTVSLAHYPVFISGDANQFKTITAPIYKFDTIIDNLVDIFYQERELQRLERLADESMKEKGITTIANVDYNEFGIVPEFNEIFKDKNLEDYDLNIHPEAREVVKKLIKEHFDMKSNSFDNFRNFCARTGVGNIDENGKYHFPKSLKNVVDIKQSGNTKLHELWINNKFAMIQQMSLMTISPAFYKNVKDLQKRYKETHSSGTLLNIEAMIDDDYVFGVDQDGKINTTMRTLYFKECKLNTEDFDPKFMNVIKHLVKKGIISQDVYNAYTEIDATDGQAYRTLDSYRKVMVGLNRWTPEMEKFYKAYKELKKRYNHNIPAEKLRSLGTIDVQFQPLKPFLFTHEKYAINSNNYLTIPVQMKCSEALIIPEFLSKDSKLRQLIEYAEDNNIDVVAATSTIKVGAWGQIDISKASSREEMSDVLNKIKEEQIHKLSYENYLIQTNVPAHDYADRLFATQIRKLILGGKYNAIVDYFGKKVPKLHGSNPDIVNQDVVRQFYNELICANFIEKLNEFKGKTSTNEQISDILIQSMIINDRNATDDIIGLDLDENGDFIMPLCEGIQEHDTTTSLISLFKKIVNKQTILGGSGVQASSYGLSDYTEDTNLHFVTNEDDTNLLWAEVIVPLVQTYTDANGKVRKIDYDKYCEEDGTLKTDSNGEILIDKDFPGIRDFVAYRIPTERAYSIINCRAVKFTRPQLGGTIKVPSQCTKISGFDFDIDKLYFMFKAFQEREDYIAPDTDNIAETKLVNAIFSQSERWVEYNFDKHVEDNPKFARDNMLVEIIRQRLMDPNTLKERVTPGGFETAKIVSKYLAFLEFHPEMFAGKRHFTMQDFEELQDASDPTPEYAYDDLETLLVFNEQNQLASKLIGIFANQNTNHVYTSSIKKLRLNTPIAFGKYSDNGLFDLLNAPDDVDTFDTLAQFLAASVDAVKEPVLNRLNLNTLTASSACLLGRLGYDMFDIGLLLSQPVIKFICNDAYKNNVSLDIAINNFYASFEGRDVSNIEASNPTRDELIFNLVNKSEKSIRSDEQIAILKLFEQVNKAAGELNMLVSKTKFTAANSVKPNFGEYFAMEADLNRFKDFEVLEIDINGSSQPINQNLEINTTGEYLRKMANNPFAFEQCMYDCMKSAMKHLLRYFPYETEMYEHVRQLLSVYNRYGNLSGKAINWLHRELPVFILSHKDDSIFNGNAQYLKNGMTQAEYYLNQFPKDLLDTLTKYPWLQETPLFKLFDISENNGNWSIKMNYSTSIDDTSNISIIIDSWEQLMYDKNPEIIRIAKDLFLYNFFKTGFGYGPSSFIRYAPELLKENMIVVPANDTKTSLSYKDFWKSLLPNSIDKTSQLSADERFEFFRLFLLNHMELPGYSINIYGDLENDFYAAINTGSLFKFNKKNIGSGRNIVINVSNLTDNVLNSIARKVKKVDKDGNPIDSDYVFIPILKFKDANGKEVYYIQQSLNGYSAKTIVYEMVEPLGISNKIVNYNNNVSLEELSKIEGEENVGEDTSENNDDLTGLSEGSNTNVENSQSTTLNNAKETEQDKETILLNELANLITMCSSMTVEQLGMSEEEYSAGVLNELTKSDLEQVISVLNDVKKSVESSKSSKKKELLDKILKDAVSKQIITIDEDGTIMPLC